MASRPFVRRPARVSARGGLPPGALRTLLPALALLLLAPGAPAASPSASALGTLTVKGKTTTLKNVVATREADPEDPEVKWLVLLVTDRPVAPVDRPPSKLRALAAAGKVAGVRVLWAEGYDRVEGIPYHVDLHVNGMRPPERPTLNLQAYDEKRVKAEVGSKMMGQDWHFQVRLEAPVATEGVFEPEPEATVESRVTGEGASPERAKKLDLGKLGYEFTEEMFFRAVADGNLPAVKLFLDLGMSANAVGPSGDHVLHYSATFCGEDPKEARGEVVKLLLAAGADPNTKAGSADYTLVSAAERCPIDAVKALIAAGADVNFRAAGGATPLWTAELRGRRDVAEALKAAGAKK